MPLLCDLEGPPMCWDATEWGALGPWALKVMRRSEHVRRKPCDLEYTVEAGCKSGCLCCMFLDDLHVVCLGMSRRKIPMMVNHGSPVRVPEVTRTGRTLYRLYHEIGVDSNKINQLELHELRCGYSFYVTLYDSYGASWLAMVKSCGIDSIQNLTSKTSKVNCELIVLLAKLCLLVMIFKFSEP